MSCVSPTFVTQGSFHFGSPCGHCHNCIARKVTDLSFMANLELQKVYKLGLGASFVTLTYNDYRLPVSKQGYYSLRKSDLQKFLKRFRYELDNIGFKYPIKHVSAGEYGDRGRPHYHLVLIGCDSLTAKTVINRVWSCDNYGLTDVQTLRSSSGIRYVLKYMSKSHPFGSVLQEYQAQGVEPPFIHHSVGLGRDWIIEHAKDVVKDGFVYRTAQGSRLYPKTVRDKVFKLTGVNPSPYIDKYLHNLPTKGLSLNDLQIEQAYYQELQQHKTQLQSGEASVFPKLPRLPLTQRPKFSYSVDYHFDTDDV